MRFEVLTAEAYAAFASEGHRLFLPQIPEYGQVRARLGADVRYVGVVADDGSVKAAGVVVLQPWKRLFKRAVLTYGPTLVDWSDTAVFNCFFTGLRAYLRRERGVLSVRINPLVHARFYDDINVITENPVAAQVQAGLERHGFTRVNAEFYDRPDIQVRYIYTKDISGQSYDEAVATMAKGLRRRFHNSGRYGVEVRFFGTEGYRIFDALHESTASRTSMGSTSASSEALYTNLVRELGPERSNIAIAYVLPRKYLQQIDDERREVTARLEVLADRKPTKNRDREIVELQARLEVLDAQQKQAEETLAEHGEEIPFCGVVSFLIGGELIELLGGMDKRFNIYGRDYPADCELLRWACSKNLDTVNTFGVSGIWDSTAPDAPVIAFKRQLRGKVEEFIGTYDQPIRPLLARLLGAVG